MVPAPIIKFTPNFAQGEESGGGIVRARWSLGLWTWNAGKEANVRTKTEATESYLPATSIVRRHLSSLSELPNQSPWPILMSLPPQVIS